jgi:hypothetical protein
MLARVTLGRPELERLAKGNTCTIRLKPGTTELAISLSVIAQGQIRDKRSSKPADPVGDLIEILNRP